ncbi:nuclear pore complex protein Nup214 [Morus notabilis]|uniref:nuclear pore complex protein Nup214 n=1 Tax=Morus notabilis TaxID=981085 RepID=UPI000CED025F|nr:nuclear pore complex protein Nup214 [Morus notabilis]
MAETKSHLLVPILLLVLLQIAEAKTPPGIAKNPSHATCKIKKYKHCYNLEHVCPKFCPNQCTVECASCKPICVGASSPPPTDSSTPYSQTPTTPSTPSHSSPTPYTPSPSKPPSTTPTTPSKPPSTTPTPPSTPSPTPSTPSPLTPPITTPTASYTPTPSTPSPTSPSPSTPSTPSPTTPSLKPPSTTPSLPPTRSGTPPSTTPSSPTPYPTPSTPSPSTPPSTTLTSPSPSTPSTPSPSTPTSPSTTPSSPTPSTPYPTPSTPSLSTPPSSITPTLPPPSTPSTPSPSTPTPSTSTTPSSSSPTTPPTSPTPSSPTSPSYPSPSPPTPSPTPDHSSSSGARKARCRNRNYPKCYNTEHVCPSTCPGGCEIDCETCNPVCKCDQPGTVCQDPRFIGGDGITFYFHGKKDHSFCLFSDPNLHINAHFIGKRNPNMRRDFTWVQSIGILFGNHKLFLGALKTAAWDDSVDRLAIAFDGESISLPQSEGASWQSKSVPSVSFVRVSGANSVVVEVEATFRITAKVIPITEEDSRIHNYGIVTEEDSFAHLDLRFKFFSLSDQVSGVLGQTYRLDYVSRVNIGAKMPVMGGDREFKSSSLFASDCAVARFEDVVGNGDIGDSLELPSLSCSSGLDGQGVVRKKGKLAAVTGDLR